MAQAEKKKVVKVTCTACGTPHYVDMDTGDVEAFAAPGDPGRGASGGSDDGSGGGEEPNSGGEKAASENEAEPTPEKKKSFWDLDDE